MAMHGRGRSKIDRRSETVRLEGDGSNGKRLVEPTRKAFGCNEREDNYADISIM